MSSFAAAFEKYIAAHQNLPTDENATSDKLNAAIKAKQRAPSATTCCRSAPDSKKPTVRKPTGKQAPEIFDVTALANRAERVAARGGSDFDVAKSLKIDETTLMIWFNSFPSLEAAVEKGRGRWLRHLSQLKRPPCPRCGGLIDETVELFGEAFHIIKKVPRCLICGKRFYRTMTPVLTRASSERK